MSISDEVTQWINKPPVKIALDHAYLNYICVKKKCYFSNEIIEIEKPSDPEIRKLVTNNLRNCPVAMTYIGSHFTVKYDGNEVLYELREV